MPWGQTFIPAWTGSGLERLFALGEEQTTITCTIDMSVIIQDLNLNLKVTWQEHIVCYRATGRGLHG